MTDDVVISASMQDDVSPALRKMQDAVNGFSRTMGLAAKDADRFGSSVTKAMRDAADASGRVGTKLDLGRQVGRQVQLAQNQLDKYKRQLVDLNNASGMKSNARGQLIDSTTGKFASADRMKAWRAENEAAYAAAERGIVRYTAAVRQAYQAEERGARLSDQLVRVNGALTNKTRDLGTAQLHQLSTSRNLLAAQMRIPEQADAARAAYQRTIDSLWAVNGATDAAGQKLGYLARNGLTSVGAGIGKLAAASPGLRYALYDVSQTATIAGVAMAAGGVAAVTMAAKWQTAFAAVERTTQTSRGALDAIHESLANLSVDIPIAFSELSEIASVGSQMGISAKGLINYTETIGKLVATTNLTATAAGTALGRFATLFSEAAGYSKDVAVTEQSFDNLGSAILKVGVNSVATESGIVNVATQLSSMATYAGYTADQTIGLAGAMSSIGVPPELSRGVITRIFTMMGGAASSGGQKLEAFAHIAGVSSDEFRSAFGTERFAPIFTSFISGLNSMQQGSGDVVTQLHELGITSVRDVPVLQRLAQATGEAGSGMSLLQQTMSDARTGWNESIELQLQYSKIAETVSARAQVMMNTFERLFATMGESSLGPVGDMIDGISSLTSGFTELMASPVGQWFSVIGVGSTVALGGILLLVGGVTRAAGAIAGFGDFLSAMTDRAEIGSRAVKGLNIALGTLGAIGLAVGIVTTLVSMANASDEAHNSIRDTAGALAAMQRDGEKSGDALKVYAEGATGAGTAAQEFSAQAEFMSGALSGASSVATEAGQSMRAMGEDAQAGALAFGDATATFMREAQLADAGFQKLFNGDRNRSAWQRLDDLGFDLDTLNAKAAAGGEADARAYIDGLTGVYAETNIGDRMFNWDATFASQDDIDLSRLTGELLKFSTSSAEGLAATAEQARIMGTAVDAAATQVAEAQEEVANTAVTAANEVGAAWQSFTATGSLIGLTQQFAAIGEAQDEAARADAAAAFESAWVDAFGGAAFSMGDYLTVFRDAAQEQQEQIDNLAALGARGVPMDILTDLAKMGTESVALVDAMVNATDAELQEYVDLYGQTGFDAMVAMAAQQLAAEGIVRNASRTLGAAAFQEFAAALSAGEPLTDVLARFQLDAQGMQISMPPLDMTAVNNSIADAEGRLWHWDSLTGTATLAAGPEPAHAAFLDVNGKLWAWDAASGTASILANSAQADGTFLLANGKRILWDQSTGTASVLADAGDAITDLNTVASRLNAVDGRTATGYVQIFGATAAINAIDNVARRLNGLGYGSATLSAGGGALGKGGANGGTPQGYYGGGYTGDGGKYQPAGLVHRGEFVMTKEATRAIGVSNLYTMMRNASRGVPAARPSTGYAGGGIVSAGSSGHIASFGPMAQQQLALALRQILKVDGRVLADTNASRNAFDNRLGRG